MNIEDSERNRKKKNKKKNVYPKMFLLEYGLKTGNFSKCFPFAHTSCGLLIFPSSEALFIL